MSEQHQDEGDVLNKAYEAYGEELDLDGDVVEVSVERDAALERWIKSRIIVPVSVYKMFIACAKKEPIAMTSFILFCHLFYMARVQETNRVWANRRFLKAGLRLGGDTVDQALAFLIDHRLVEKMPGERQKGGRLGKTYLRLKCIPRSKSHPCPNGGNGEKAHLCPGTVALDRARKCFNIKKNYGSRKNPESQSLRDFDAGYKKPWNQYE